MRLSPLLLTLLCATPFTTQASSENDENIRCAAYYEILSVAGDQPDMSRKQSSKAFYVFLKRAGDTPVAQDDVAQKMVELAKEIPGKMTPKNIAPFRARHDAQCSALLKSA
ncbi:MULTISPECIES: hypothetical protein [Pseudomonas]|uniref:hypothetical protein n=1 Tax=Pseudomonas TaxID=286 RepID=UPI000CD137E3|nr:MULTISPECIES: hypothetical protein [unclassified Pseudomonas]POA30950.1 hypothetical protein C1887_14615 [Pseudomonas sp. GW456-R21]POA67978.1 hypothetical protein C1884_11320 [Pseudomonas sp. GW460-R15]